LRSCLRLLHPAATWPHGSRYPSPSWGIVSSSTSPQPDRIRRPGDALGEDSSVLRRAKGWSGRGRARAQQRLPLERRQGLLDGIYAGGPFRTVVRDLGLTPNQVWGLTKTDRDWATALEAALTAIRRDDLKHGTTAAYVAGCVCKECREHQRVRMSKNRV
jgi:hypothetical protein